MHTQVGICQPNSLHITSESGLDNFIAYVDTTKSQVVVIVVVVMVDVVFIATFF